MSRRVRHVHADSDEWIVVHRDPPSDGGCGCIIAIIILVALLGGC